MISWFGHRRVVLNTPAPHQLHLGCGRVAPEGWINCDGSWHVWLASRPWTRSVLHGLGLLSLEQANQPWPASIVRVNLRHPLPFADSTFSAVYSSHLLEHLYRDEAVALLQEIHRCCRPGGVVRIAVPDLAKYLEDYRLGVISPRAPAATPADSLLARLQLRPATAPMQGARLPALVALWLDFNSHKWHYDQDSLQHLFRQAGFAHPESREILVSRIPDIERIERPERIGGGATLIVEAVRE